MTGGEDEEGWAPFAPDDAEPAGEAPRGRAALSLVDEIVPVTREAPESRVWALLDLAKVPNSGDPGRFYPKPTPSNVHYVLSQDSRWCGRIRANDFDGQLYLEARTITDTDLTEIVHWLERVYGLRCNEERVARTLVVCGSEHTWHPIRDWLGSLVWDRADRLDRLLGDYLGASPCTDDSGDGPSNDLLATLGRCFMVSCVARIMQPGCKVDTTLILVGPQGAMKSTACRILANGWFSDTALDLHTKDFYESIQGVWLYELAELDAFNRGEWSKVKAVLSSTVDRWRRPYGKSVQARPRQCVFLGTTNQEQFLGDLTGSRRFWPVRVGRVDAARLRADVAQLWAEAVVRYRAGEQWWLDADRAAELAAVSAHHAIGNAWWFPVTDWLQKQGPRAVSTADILTEALEKPTGQWTRNDESEVGGILRRAGYTRVRRRINGQRAWIWVPPE